MPARRSERPQDMPPTPPPTINTFSLPDNCSPRWFPDAGLRRDVIERYRIVEWAVRDPASARGSRPQANDQVDPGDFHAFGRLGQATELHVLELHVAQRAGLLVAEVIVRADVRIEPGAVAIDAELANQAVCGKEIERVVDRGLGDARAVAAQRLGDLLGRQVLRR